MWAVLGLLLIVCRRLGHSLLRCACDGDPRSEYCFERNWVEPPWHRLKLRHRKRIDVGTPQEREVAEVLQGDQLEDVVRGAELCRDEDTLAPDKRAQLGRFIDAHRLAERLFEARIALEENAHPHYTMTAGLAVQPVEAPTCPVTPAAAAPVPPIVGTAAPGAALRADEPMSRDITLFACPFDIGCMQAQLDSLTEELTAWQRAVTESEERCPRLLFMRTSQRLRFLWALRTLWGAAIAAPGGGAPPPPPPPLRILMPYIALCFPEAPRDGAWEAKLWAAVRRLAEAAKRGRPDGDAEGLLRFAADLLDALTSSGAESWLPPPPAQPHRAPVFDARTLTVTMATGMTPLQCLLLSVKPWWAHTVVPLAEVLDCTSPAMIPSLDDFRRLLKCTTRFPHLTGFVLLGVDKLTPGYRDALLEHVSAVFQHRIPTAPLRLIFLSQAGSEVFTSFLSQEPADVDQVAALQGALFAGACQRLGVQHFERVVGPPLSGKSLYVSERLRTEFTGNDRQTRITVNEDFGASLVLVRWRQLHWIAGDAPDTTAPQPVGTQARHVAVHWNIPEFAPFGVFNRFLFGFFFGGMLCDETTGETVFAPSSDALLWSFFTELAPDRTGTPESQQILTQLPLLRLLTDKHIKATNPADPYLLDGEARMVAAFLQRYEQGTLATDWKNLRQVTPPLADDALCRSLLNAAWGVGARAHGCVWQCLGHVPQHVKARCQMSIRLMAVRINWLLDSHVRNAPADRDALGDWAGIDPSSIPKLFEAFLREVDGLCNPNFRADWTRGDVPYIVRSRIPGDYSYGVVYFGPYAKMPFPHVLDRAEADANPARLRSAIAPAFGRPVMWPVTSQMNYILTCDFAVKGLMMVERSATRFSTILRGDTGTGKVRIRLLGWRGAGSQIVSACVIFHACLLGSAQTELMRFVSTALNMSGEVFPDWGTILQPHFARVLPIGETLSYNPAACVRLIGEGLATLTPERWAAFCQDECQKLRATVNGIYQQAAKSPLAPTPDIAAFLDGSTPIRTPADLLHFVQAVLENVPRGLFHRFLVHELYTAAEFKRDVATVAAAARRFPSHTIVGFFDEYNTTKTIRCTMKEVFVDHRLDGIPLPENIFWVVCARSSAERAHVLSGRNQPSQDQRADRRTRVHRL